MLPLAFFDDVLLPDWSERVANADLCEGEMMQPYAESEDPVQYGFPMGASQ